MWYVHMIIWPIHENVKKTTMTNAIMWSPHGKEKLLLWRKELNTKFLNETRHLSIRQLWRRTLDSVAAALGLFTISTSLASSKSYSS